MPYELRDRPGSDGVEAPSAEVKIDTPGGTDERRVEVGSRQVEQLLEMLGKLAVSPHVYNTPIGKGGKKNIPRPYLWAAFAGRSLIFTCVDFL